MSETLVGLQAVFTHIAVHLVAITVSNNFKKNLKHPIEIVLLSNFKFVCEQAFGQKPSGKCFIWLSVSAKMSAIW
jgi:hypothetical protein